MIGESVGEPRQQGGFGEEQQDEGFPESTAETEALIGISDSKENDEERADREMNSALAAHGRDV